MAAASFLGYCYYSYLAKPCADRVLYRELRKKPAVKILELGVGRAVRTTRLIQVIQRYLRDTNIQYTGIDQFETRADGSGMPLKEAYRKLKPLGATVQLIPGDPYSALARSANSLLGLDFIVIAADQDTESLQRAWKYMPRMLHAGTRIFLEQRHAKEGTRFTPLPAGQINQLASASRIATRQETRRAA